MYVIDQKTNRVKKLDPQKFKEANFEERKNLQEWIANEPNIFNEELLIIQKEFDGFDNTQERLDLLALDKDGNLVLIENKLDDTGRDVTWQALKYASYCSTLKNDQVKDVFQKYLGSEKNAEELISNFLNKKSFDEVDLNNEQRIILVSGSYRKEVTSTVLWLRNKYLLNIKCFEVSLSNLNGQYILDIEQIIPAKKEVDDYMISISDKNREEITIKARTAKNLEFWTTIIASSNKTNKLYESISPSKDSWIAKSLGSSIQLCLVISKTFARTEIYLNKSKQENKKVFDQLLLQKTEIEKLLGVELFWDRIDNKNASRISFQLENVNIENKDDWDKMILFFIEYSVKFEQCFKPFLEKIKTLK
jgi:hypothetical protein